VNAMTIKLVFAVSPLSIKSKSKTGWLEIRIMCSNIALFLPADCFSELAL